MGQQPYKIANQYDSLAEVWTDTFLGEHEKKPKDREVLQRFARELGGRRPVWDLGCGPGNTTKFLNDLRVETSGLDLSEKILEQARQVHPGLHFRKGNILDLEFENDSIAGAVAFYAIIHLAEEEVHAAFREVFRVLQPGGIFLLAYHVGEGTIHLDEFLNKKVDLDVMFFTTECIFNSLKNTGFEKVETIEREPYPGVEYESRRAYVFAFKPDLRHSPD